jgi:hypothetical protein
MAPVLLIKLLTLTRPTAVALPAAFDRRLLQLHQRVHHMFAQLSQDDEAGENSVPTDQVEKYVSVYKAMQHNRTMTIDQAAAAQGLTLEQFRDLENRVERDDAASQQARDELQDAAQQATPAADKTPAPARH